MSSKWFLSGNHSGWPSGQPFGDGSERWQRARESGLNPWDEDCEVTPLIGGHAVMDDIRKTFEYVIGEAKGGSNYHVYIAGWRFNPNRDMSMNTDPWHFDPVEEDRANQTAWGLVKQLIFAGVKVRIIVWLPPTKPEPIENLFLPHIQAHLYLARLVRAANLEAKDKRHLQPEDDDLGVVFLDSRISESDAHWTSRLIGSHHQKFIVVRGANKNVAYCGGVDLAYTRRDAPKFHGDWQSGDSISPQGRGIVSSVPPVTPPDEGQQTDLPERINNKDMYGEGWQSWHDQHLKLEGPVVKTLEYVFVERWIDPPRVCIELSKVEGNEPRFSFGSIISSSDIAIDLEFLSRKYASMPDDKGSTKTSYFIEFGVIDKDIIKVLIDGQPIAEAWEVDEWGIIHLQASLETKKKWQGKSLEIQFRNMRPKPLPEPSDFPDFTTTADKRAAVQVWQTIPFRGRARGTFDGSKWASLTQSGDVEPPLAPLTPTVLIPEPLIPIEPFPDPAYRMGEFSIMAGIANACEQAEELIWIFDQYFWSVPYALLLKKMLLDKENLHLVIVLPPWSDQIPELQAETQHDLRWNALRILGDSGIKDKVAVYVPWLHGPSGGLGIYCHAKVQLFDDQLLVCGSCNINERSFTFDSELSCAVNSKVVVQKHYQELWNHFIKQSNSDDPNVYSQFKFPTDFSKGWGMKFFAELKKVTKWPMDGWASLNYERAHLETLITLPNQSVERTAPDLIHELTNTYTAAELTSELLQELVRSKVLDPINNPIGLAWENFIYRDISGIVHDIHNYSSALKKNRRQYSLNESRR